MSADPQQWYYSANGQQHGPITGAELRQLAHAGTVGPDTLVWRTGAAEWKPARAVKGLLPPTPSSGPPPLPPDDLSAPPVARRRPDAGPSSQFPANLLASLGAKNRAAIWTKLGSGFGLFLIFVAILCPWYSVESKSSVDFSGVSGFNGRTMPGQRGKGFSFDDDGLGRTSASVSVPLRGIDTIPGILALFPLLAVAGLSFLPWKWSSLAAVGAGLLLGLVVLVALIYSPHTGESTQAGRPGAGFSSSVTVHNSWGVVPALLGAGVVTVAPALAFFGIGSRRPGRPTPTPA